MSVARKVVVSNPVPVVYSDELLEVREGSGDLPISLLLNPGTHVVAGAFIRADGIALPTTMVSERYVPYFTRRIEAVVPEAMLTTARSIALTVVNPGPGGGESDPITLEVVTTGNDLPSIASLSVDEFDRATPASLTISGSFPSGTSIVADGSGFATLSVGPSSLSANLDAFTLSTAGTHPLVARTSAPGGGVSNQVFFTIKGSNPVPSISGLYAGGQPITSVNVVDRWDESETPIEIHGSDFVLKSVVRAKTSGAFVSVGTCSDFDRCTASIPPELLRDNGTLTIEIENPAPGGGVTATSLPIVNPTPTIVQNLTSYLLKQPTGEQTVRFSATGLYHASRIVEETTDTLIETTFHCDNPFAIGTVPGALTSTAGTLKFKIRNPAPGGGETATVDIPVHPIPTLTSISPATVAAGSASFTLTLEGTDLDQPSNTPVVIVHDRPSMELSPTSTGATWTVTIPGSLVATPKHLDIEAAFKEHPRGSNRMRLTVE